MNRKSHMTSKIKLIAIDKLRAHEETSPERVLQVMREIKRLGKIKNPVVVDIKTRVILDGHHRVKVLKKLGCEKVPVMMVNYMSNQVRVCLRRKMELEDIKQAVIKKSLKGEVFEYKTTRHLVKNRIRGVNIPLDVLGAIQPLKGNKFK